MRWLSQGTQLVSGRAGIQKQTFCSKPGSQPLHITGLRGLGAGGGRPHPCHRLCRASGSRRAVLLSAPGPDGNPCVSWHLPPGEFEAPWGQGREMEGPVLCLHLAACPSLGVGGESLFHAGGPQGFFWLLADSRVVPAGVGECCGA